MHSPSEVDNRLTKGVGTLFSLFSKKSKNVIFFMYYEWLHLARGLAAEGKIGTHGARDGEASLGEKENKAC
jgi:hypothetical protein